MSALSVSQLSVENLVEIDRLMERSEEGLFQSQSVNNRADNAFTKKVSLGAGIICILPMFGQYQPPSFQFRVGQSNTYQVSSIDDVANVLEPISIVEHELSLLGNSTFPTSVETIAHEDLLVENDIISAYSKNMGSFLANQKKKIIL